MFEYAKGLNLYVLSVCVYGRQITITCKNTQITDDAADDDDNADAADHDYDDGNDDDVDHDHDDDVDHASSSEIGMACLNSWGFWKMHK